MKQQFDLLVFDWDGTLIDSIGWIVECIQQAAEACGLDKPDNRAARSVIGLSLQQAMQALYPGQPPEKAERLAAHYRDYYRRHAQSSIELFEGVEAMLERLASEGYRLAVATGKARSGLDHALRQTGMTERFHGTRCADETASKPDPLMLNQLMEEMGVPRERTLLIGDSFHDMHMARNAAVASVAVGCGANTLEELATTDPLTTLETTPELLNLLI